VSHAKEKARGHTRRMGDDPYYEQLHAKEKARGHTRRMGDDAYEQLHEMMSATIQEILAVMADSEAKAQKELEEAKKKIKALEIENKSLKAENESLEADARSHHAYCQYFV